MYAWTWPTFSRSERSPSRDALMLAARGARIAKDPKALDVSIFTYKTITTNHKQTDLRKFLLRFMAHKCRMGVQNRHYVYTCFLWHFPGQGCWCVHYAKRTYHPHAHVHWSCKICFVTATHLHYIQCAILDTCERAEYYCAEHRTCV
jgi:hypothetical protein